MNCPHCQRLLHSRQHPKCGWCGQELPPECRLPDKAVARMKTEIREINHRLAMAREAERKAESAQEESGVGYTDISGFFQGY